MRFEPRPSRPAPGWRQRDLGADPARDPGSRIAKALTAVLPPAARTSDDIFVRQSFLAPFSRPSRFPSRARLPLSFEMRLPCQPARVSQPHPRKMKIFVEQDPAMLPGTLFQIGIEKD